MRTVPLTSSSADLGMCCIAGDIFDNHVHWVTPTGHQKAGYLSPRWYMRMEIYDGIISTGGKWFVD
jgi:hypothetical protein